MTIDSRFSSSPSVLKLVAMIVAVALDHRRAGRPGSPRRHRRPQRTDASCPHAGGSSPVSTAVVVGTLVVLALHRREHRRRRLPAHHGPSLAETPGYMANYFRWFGVPEAPFGWYYDVLAVMAKISTASPFMRLPALLAGILCWMVISREVVPRLGRAVRRSNVALWTGGLVFLVLLAGVQQRSSPRAHRRSRRTAHLVLHRARHRHRTPAARGHGNLDRRLHSCRRTHRIDVYRSPSRRCAPVGAHRRQASPTGRHTAASRSDRRCRNHRAGGHLRRPDLCRRHGSHARPNDHRARISSGTRTSCATTTSSSRRSTARLPDASRS